LGDELPEEAVAGTAALLPRVILRRIDPDQAWFWTPAWQAGEREAEADLAAGRLRCFDRDAAFLAHLARVPPAPDPPACGEQGLVR
jgi:hypothetical protein